MPRLGLIADTHNRLPPAALERFRGVDHILHAGDVGNPTILASLESVAPVTAVLGNTDYEPGWRETEVVEFAGTRCLIRHIVDPDYLTPDLRRQLAKVQPHVVVFGHTHRPFLEQRNGVLFVNPGSPCRPRGGHAPTVAILRLEADGPHVDFAGV